MILDSPFSDLTVLCEEMVAKAREQGIIVPGVVASLAIRLLQTSVQKQAGFSIQHISPIAHADRCFIPALFVAGEHDDFIAPQHAQRLHERYAGDKNLLLVDGDHNSPRPKFLLDSASIFLTSCLQLPPSWALDVPVSMNLLCPPWYWQVYEQRAQQRRQRVVETGVPVTGPPANNNNNNNAFDPDSMGMTTERQRVIQASLFKMLGQADDTTQAAGAAGGGAAADVHTTNGGGK